MTYSAQMASLLSRYGVTTQRDLLRKIAAEYTEETGERYTIKDAALMLDGMLDAEYERIQSGAYDARKVQDEMSEKINDVVYAETAAAEPWNDEAGAEKVAEAKARVSKALRSRKTTPEQAVATVLAAEYEDLGPVVNPDGTPTDVTVEMLTGKATVPAPVQTPKATRKASRAGRLSPVGRTAKPKAEAKPKALKVRKPLKARPGVDGSIAGLRETFTARNGSRIQIFVAAEADIDTAGGAWATVCCQHASILNTSSWRKAAYAGHAPESFCEGCREMAAVKADQAREAAFVKEQERRQAERDAAKQARSEKAAADRKARQSAKASKPEPIPTPRKPRVRKTAVATA